MTTTTKKNASARDTDPSRSRTPTLTRIPLDAIVASPDQNRTTFDPAALEELAQSITELGLLQPVVVRIANTGCLSTGYSYVLVAGERRVRACRDLLGWADIPAIVHPDDPDESAALRTLAENMVREDPGPLDEATGLAQATDRYGLSPTALAHKLGKSPAWVKARLALLELAPDVAHYVWTGDLPLGRAAMLAGLDPNRQRLALQAHQNVISTETFRRIAARLLDEQHADTMFDTDSFLKVDEYVTDAKNVDAGSTDDPAQSGPTVIREIPLGIAEIAQLLDVKPGTVAQWRQRHIFPHPELTVGGSPAWWADTIIEWAEATGRR